MTCSDCTGQDEMGCNDGLPWWYDHDDGSPMLFNSEEEAQKYLDDHWHEQVFASPWEGKVERRT